MYAINVVSSVSVHEPGNRTGDLQGSFVASIASVVGHAATQTISSPGGPASIGVDRASPPASTAASTTGVSGDSAWREQAASVAKMATTRRIFVSLADSESLRSGDKEKQSPSEREGRIDPG